MRLSKIIGPTSPPDEGTVTCTWSPSAPYADLVNVGSCRKDVALTSNFAFERFGQLCTDNQTNAKIGGVLSVALPLEEDEPVEEQPAPLVDPAKRELERLAEEQRINDEADRMVRQAYGGDGFAGEPSRPGEAFQPKRTLFLPHVVDYRQKFTLRLRIRGERTPQEMRKQRVKLVKEGGSCDERSSDAVSGLGLSTEPTTVKGQEVVWDGLEVPGNGEAKIFDVCFCSGDGGCGHKKYIRLRGKLVAGEATASKCIAWGYEVAGFKRIPNHPGTQIVRCVYDQRAPGAERVEIHCQKVMAFFPPGYDVHYWGSDTSCAKSGQQITRRVAAR